MPPWHADPRYGKFANDRRLSREERDTLLAWIDQGCPKGDDKDLPPPLTFIQRLEDRRAGQGLLDGQGIQGAGHRRAGLSSGSSWTPASRKTSGCRRPSAGRATARSSITSSSTSWRPGERDPTTPTARRPRSSAGRRATCRRSMRRTRPGSIPAGSKLLFEVHYTPNGTEQTDRSSVGFDLRQEAARELRRDEHPGEHALQDSRRGPPTTRAQMTYTFPDDALVLSFMPHMHLRGVSAPIRADLPRRYDRDIAVGARLRLRLAERLPFREAAARTQRKQADLDRPLGQLGRQPRNPDPNKAVFWGLQTWDEMQNGWMEVVWREFSRDQIPFLPRQFAGKPDPDCPAPDPRETAPASTLLFRADDGVPVGRRLLRPWRRADPHAAAATVSWQNTGKSPAPIPRRTGDNF